MWFGDLDAFWGFTREDQVKLMALWQAQIPAPKQAPGGPAKGLAGIRQLLQAARKDVSNG